MPRPPIGEQLVTRIFSKIDIDSINYVILCNEVQNMFQNRKGLYDPLFGLLVEHPITRIYNYIDPNRTSLGAYNAKTNTFQIINNNTLLSNVVNEELIHAGQNWVYAGGTYQYAESTGASNIEFEAKLTMDLINYVNGEAFQSGEDAEYRLEYPIWIDALCSTGPGLEDLEFPSASRVLIVTVDGIGYYQLMEGFIKGNPNYDFPIIYTLKPLFINYTYRTIHQENREENESIL